MRRRGRPPMRKPARAEREAGGDGDHQTAVEENAASCAHQCDGDAGRQARADDGAALARAYPSAEHAHRMRNVLEPLLAQFVEHDVELAANIVTHALGDADAARRGERLEASRDIDALAPHVAAIDDQIPEIEPHAELDPPVHLYVGIPFRHAALNRKRTAPCVHDAGELRQNTIAGHPNNPSCMSLNRGRDELVPMRMPLEQRAMLIGTDEPAVTCDIGSENCGKAALDMSGHGDVRLRALLGARSGPERGDIDGRVANKSPARWRLMIVRDQQCHFRHPKFCLTRPDALPLSSASMQHPRPSGAEWRCSTNQFTTLERHLREAGAVFARRHAGVTFEQSAEERDVTITNLWRNRLN